MKWFSVIVALFLGLAGAPAQSADDQYINIHSLIQEADTLNSGGQPGEALPSTWRSRKPCSSSKRGIRSGIPM